MAVIWRKLAFDDDVLLVDGTKAMAGDLDMGTHKIANLVDPIDDQDAATKKFVVDQITAAFAKSAVLGTL